MQRSAAESRARRGGTLLSALVAALFSTQCLGDFVAPEDTIYEVAALGALTDSVHVGDTVSLPPVQLKVNGAVMTTAWTGSVVAGDDVMKVDSTSRLIVLKLGQVTLRVRPLNASITDTSKFVDFTLRGVIARLTVGGPDTAYAIGDTVQPTPVPQSPSGVALTNSGASFTWNVEGSDSAATLLSSVTGAVRAVRNGQIRIRAKSDTASAIRTIVVSQRPASFTVSPVSLVLTSSAQTLTPTARDSRGNAMSASGIAFASLNTDVATVNASGVVTPVSSGQTSISMSAGGFAAYALVTVSMPGATPAGWFGQIDSIAPPLTNLWGTSATNIYATGLIGVLRRFDGTNWTSISTGATAGFWGLWGSSANDVYTVQPAYRWDGSQWSAVTSFSGGGFGIWGSSPSDIWAVGDNGRISRYNGTSWSTITHSLTTERLRRVWGSSPSDVWIVGQGGVILRWNGSTLVQVPSGTTADLFHVWGSGPNDAYAVGGSGTGVALRFDGTSWQPLALGSLQADLAGTGFVYGVWGTSASDVYVAAGGQVFRWNGSSWTKIPVQGNMTPGFHARAIWGTSTGDIFVGDWQGRVARGKRISSVTLAPASVTLASVGATQQLTPTSTDAAGSVSGVSYSWTSSNTAVATVNGSGLVTAVTNGSTNVCATIPGGVQGCRTVTVNVPDLCTGTPHSGSITANETWTIAASPHCVTGQLSVSGGVTLTIEAGTVVQFTTAAGIDLGSGGSPGTSAKLRALGTSTSPITFTAADGTAGKGAWMGIRTHWMNASDSLILQHVILEKAGHQGTWHVDQASTVGSQNQCIGTFLLEQVTIRQTTNDGINTNCRLVVRDSRIENFDRRGIWSSGDGLTTVTNTRVQDGTTGIVVHPGTLDAITGTRVTTMGAEPIHVAPSGLVALQDLPVDSLLGNTRQEIIVVGSGDITSRDLVVDSRLPWHVQGTVAIGGGRKVTILPGTTVKLQGGAQIYFGLGSTTTPIGGGRLVADGSAGQIRFTSGRANPQPGDWLVLKFSGDTSVLRNVVVEYGGGGAQMMVEANSPLIVDRLTVRRGAGNGISGGLSPDGIGAGQLIVQGPIFADSNGGRGLVLNTPNVSLVDSRFAGNGGAGLWTSRDAKKLQILRSTFLRNGGSGAELHADSITVDSSVFRRNASGGIGGGGDGGTPTNNPIVTIIRRSVVDSNSGDGISLGGSVAPIIENNSIVANAGIGLVHHNGGRLAGNRIRANRLPLAVNPHGLSAITSQDIDSLLGNTGDTLLIQGGGGSSVVSTDTIRTTGILPWRVDNSLQFDNGTVWKLDPGARVIMASGSSIRVDDATVRAVGTAANPILVTGATASRGSWGWFDFQRKRDTSLLRHIEFRYGGNVQDANGPFNVRVAGAAGPPVIFDSVRVTQSAGDGIRLDNPAIFRGRVVADSNADDGISIQEVRGITIPNGDLSFNGGHGLFAFKGSVDSLRIIGGRFTKNGKSGLKLCGDSALIQNATFTHNAAFGVDIQFGGCPTDGSVTLQQYTVENVRADSNGSDGLTYQAGSSMRIRNSRFIRNGQNGVRFGVGVDEFTDNRVTANGAHPISTGVHALTALEDQNVDSLLGNAIDEILISQGGDLTSRSITMRQRLPWRVQSTVAIGGGHTLTIEPGTTVRLSQGGHLFIGVNSSGVDNIGSARLVADGNAGQIRFTSSSSNPQPGEWHNVMLARLSDTSIVRNVVFEYGGRGSPTPTVPQSMLSIGSITSAPAVIDRVTARRGLGDGISAGGTVLVQGPIYADSNGGHGMVLNARDVNLVDSRFVGNGGRGLHTSPGARELSIRRSSVIRNASDGVGIHADSITIDSSVVRRNSLDGITTLNGTPGGHAKIRWSVVDSNAQSGIMLGGSAGSTVDSTLVAHNGGTGIVYATRIQGNRVKGNLIPLLIDAAGIAGTTQQNVDSLLGNAGDSIVVDCCGGDDEVRSADTVRTTARLPWVIKRNVRFVDRTVWKVEPGATVYLSGGRIQIGQNPSCNGPTQGAVLHAVSDDNAPIRFTSRNQTRGAWGQLLIECLSDTTRLRNVEISYAGGPGGPDAVRIAPGTAGVPVILDSVVIRQSADRGLLIQNGSKVIIERFLAADSNSNVGLYVEPSGVTVPAGRFRGNGGQAGVDVFAHRFSLSNAVVSHSTGNGIGLHGDSATITNTKVIRNGGNGIFVLGGSSRGHLIQSSTIDTNSGKGLYLDGGPSRLVNTRIFNNGGDGIFSNQTTTQLFTEFTGNTISGNNGYGVMLDVASLGPFASQIQTVILGNAKDTLCVCAGPSNFAVTTGSPTVEAFLPWKVQPFMSIGGNQTLSVKAGATVILGGLWIGGGPFGGVGAGRLLSLGTAASPVRFVTHDSSNSANRFHTLAIINQSDISILRHTRLEHGGHPNWRAALHIADAAGREVRLDTVTVRKGGPHGVYVASPVTINGLAAFDNDSSGIVIAGGTVAISGSRFERNDIGIRVDAGSGHTITGSILEGNLTWGLRNLTLNTVTATGNWWGAACGPVHSTNPGCSGTNPVSDNVNFSSPLESRPAVP